MNTSAPQRLSNQGRDQRAPSRRPRSFTARVRRSRVVLLRPRREDDVKRLSPPPHFRVERLDREAREVVRRLNRAGFDAYFVGGCVRDLLLGHVPKDFDIATEATPREVKRLFRNSRIIGRRFRLVHIAFRDKVLDVSTFRASQTKAADGDDADPMIRHDNVFGTAREDAHRRDFTINGLFFDLASHRVIDYVGGLSDLDRRVIKTIGDPWRRFREDPVRMLRAIKFAGRLNFGFDEQTWLALLDCRADLRKASAPRVLEEIIRLMNRGGGRRSIELAFSSGVLEILLPEVAAALKQSFQRGEVPALFAQLEQIDQRLRARVPVDHVLMLAFLLLPLCEHEVYELEAEGTRSPLRLSLEEVLRPVVRRLHLSRRDTHRIQEVLEAQRGFLSKQRKQKRFLARPVFRDAWRFFRIYGETTGRFAEERLEWTQRVRRPESERGVH